MPIKKQDFLDRRCFKYSYDITNNILGYRNGLGQSGVPGNHYLRVNCVGKSCTAAPGRLTEDARLLSAWLRAQVWFSLVLINRTFFCKTKSNQCSFWNALIHQQGLAEVVFHFRSLNQILGELGVGNQALDWPNILKVLFKNQVRFRIPLPLKCVLLSSNAYQKIILKLK